MMPSMFDGLMPGQRKILFSSFKQKNFVEEKLSISRFSDYVIAHSAYHHGGEASLARTIIGMAHDFVGSNNINLLQPFGRFGTRVCGGKDAANARHLCTRLSSITRYLFPKDDDIFLDYLNEGGKSIEPTRYMPVIPTVLVNGCRRIGPKYNPRDIVANIRRLLNGEPTEPMVPWYKGFKGIIEKSPTKKGGFSYTSTGIIEEINETTLRITELPIGRWTKEYNKFLNSMVTGNEKIKDPFIEKVRDYCDSATVHFEVVLSEANLALAKKEGLLKKFKLTKTISTSNMHLLDSSGTRKRYGTPEDILTVFFHARLAIYDKRKKALLDNLELECLKLENKVRFILGVMQGEITVRNRKLADVFVLLRDMGFTSFPKEAEQVVAGASDDTDEETDESSEFGGYGSYLLSLPIGSLTLGDGGSTPFCEETKAAEPVAAGASDGETVENLEVVGPEGVRAGDYRYLLLMPIGALTAEKVQELCAEKDKLKGQVEDLKKATPKSLWLKDLDALDSQLDELDKAEEERKALRSWFRAKVADILNPRKAPSTESVPEAKETSNTSTMETDNAPEVAKKAPSRKRKAVTVLKDEDDDDDVEDEGRLAAYAAAARLIAGVFKPVDADSNNAIEILPKKKVTKLV